MTEDNPAAGAITLAREDERTFTMRFRLPSLARLRSTQAAALVLYLAALAIGVYGSGRLRGADIFHRSEARELAEGAPFLLSAFLLWLFAELIDNRRALRLWWRGQDRSAKIRQLARIVPLLVGLRGLVAFFDATAAAPKEALAQARDALGWFALALFLWLLIDAARLLLRKRSAELPFFATGIEDEPQPQALQSQRDWAMPSWQSFSATRILLFALAAISSAAVWINSAGNYFPPPAVGLWVGSTALWALAFAPGKWNLLLWLHAKLNRDWVVPWRRFWWAYIAFALIMAAGLGFRLTDIERMPPEMNGGTFLHLLETWHLSQGALTPVYFPQDGGRPLLSFYLTAALAAAPGFGFDHSTLKLSTALPSALALALMFWLGLEFIGRRRLNIGIVTGLLLMGLVAASRWDVAVARTGYGMNLTAICSALLGIFLIRAVRFNRRADFILAGLALGYSLHTYQPARAFPLAVLAAALIALALRRISWRERLTYALNLAVLAIVAFMVFLPLFRFMLEQPDLYWRRLNEVTANEPKSGAYDEPRADETLLASLMSNIRRHLLMYHWRGDPDWSRGGVGAPTLSAVAGATLLLGLAALSVRLVRSRDPILWMIPAILLIMHLPSVIVVEHLHIKDTAPSHTRSIGALPYIYLLSAFPLVLIARQLRRVFPKSIAALLGAIFCGVALLLSYQQNTDFYFGQQYEKTLYKLPPASEGGRVLRGFIESGGAIGNAFIIYSPGTGEPRFIAAEAGYLDYENGLWDLSQLPRRLGNALFREEYPLDPARDLFFLYSAADQHFTMELYRLFPLGYAQTIASSLANHHGYAVFRAPAIGEAGFQGLFETHVRG